MPATTTQNFRHGGSELALALASVRGRLVLILALLGLVVLGWWWTASTMAGMDQGPWTQLGPLAFFLVAWTVMMYAMMFPSIAPTVALYARMTRSRAPALPVFFSIGYMLVWIGAGLLAYAVGVAASALFGDSLAWDAAGRHVAAVTLVLCAAYQLTSLKQACLDKCRTPLAFLLGAWRDGKRGALWMGMKNGAWCLGCCWALMAALFALGIMSITWMAMLTLVMTGEKLLPWRRVGRYAGTALLLALGVLVFVAPNAIPALTIPPVGGGMAMPGMPGMHGMGG